MIKFSIMKFEEIYDRFDFVFRLVYYFKYLNNDFLIFIFIKFLSFNFVNIYCMYIFICVYFCVLK